MKRRRKGRAVNGWLVIDKPSGLTSTQVVGRVRRALDARKAGHGGTLDPLATGLLPIALGEATKTVSYVMEGAKRYRFTLRWGQATDTDDAEGKVIEESPHRPTPAEVEAVLPLFQGWIDQVPPVYSAIKVDGQRASLFIRDGQVVDVQASVDAPSPLLALKQLIDWEQGTFEFRSGAVDRADSLTVPVQALLMELARGQDEEARRRRGPQDGD